MATFTTAKPAPPAAGPLPVGAILSGRFALTAILGQGATATVYRATDLYTCHAHETPVEVAVKIGREADHHRGSLWQRMMHEGAVLRTVKHPNIPCVHGVGEAGTRPFLALDFLPGRTLAAILRERAGLGLDRSVAVRIALDLGEALEAVHRHGLIHGDIKPGNVIVRPDGRAGLIDFAAAQTYRPRGIGGTRAEPFHNGGDDLTPAYASPWRLAGDPPDPRDDMFSLALLAYAMLYGRHPFGGRPCLDAEAEGAAPVRPPDVGGARWAVLRSALAMDSIARPSGAARFAARLRHPSLSDHLRAWCTAASGRIARPASLSPAYAPS